MVINFGIWSCRPGRWDEMPRVRSKRVSDVHIHAKIRPEEATKADEMLVTFCAQVTSTHGPIETLALKAE